MDVTDIKILRLLQENCTMPVAEIAEKVGLSTTPCWRRIQKLEQDGVIERRVALLNARKINAGVTVFVSVTAAVHSAAWFERFQAAVQSFPEVIEVYRMSGQVDYLLRVVAPDVERYDVFYRKLIAQVELSNVSSSFAMEEIKFTTALPLDYVES